MKKYILLLTCIATLVACSSAPKLNTVSSKAREIPINSAEKASEIQKKHSN